MELILAKDLFYDAYLFKNICYYKPKQHKKITYVTMNNVVSKVSMKFHSFIN
jgi:hypothetical protein